ncbi:thioesterase-like superfamily-domain-containing protein [Hysterangium stoloniferum]|nr:thioesterase-like superfamily-domain-containing protein [Hysterangium stoloniferum]
MCQFLRTMSIAPFEVHVRTIRSGKFNANLTAELVQNGEVKISAHLIFKAQSTGSEDARLTLAPSSPFARRVPIHLHPSVAVLTPMCGDVNFHTKVRWAEDETVKERNRGGGLEWGAWLELTDPFECLNYSMLPFMGDMLKGLPLLLPEDQRPPSSGLASNYGIYVGVFKAQIPDDPSFSQRNSMDPAQQHTSGVEIEGWRDNQVCLGVAHQMALTVPYEVNTRKASEANSNSRL